MRIEVASRANRCIQAGTSEYLILRALAFRQSLLTHVDEVGVVPSCCCRVAVVIEVNASPVYRTQDVPENERNRTVKKNKSKKKN